MPSFDNPNVSIPLAASYNERGIDGYATTVTNGYDQRKINSIYEPVKNSVTGKTTLYLTKRPGPRIKIAGIGSATDIPYLAIADPSKVALSWIACLNGSNIIVKTNGGTSTTVFTQTSTYPVYFDKTLVSNVPTAVLQAYRSSTGVWRTWYSTAIATWTEITDADYTAQNTIYCGKSEFMDGFMFQMTSDNRIFNSDINSLANWTASSYLTKQIEQDYGRGLARLGSKIIAFGMETLEVFYNAGNATGSPLSGIKGMSQKIGVVTDHADTTVSLATRPTDGVRHYTATLGGRLYFIGREAGRASEHFGLYMFDGSSATKVSPPNIDKFFFAGGPTYLSTFSVPGQKAIAISIGSMQASSATQRWLMYFPDWNEWFEWTSTEIQPISDGSYFIGIGGQTNANSLFLFDGTSQWMDGTTTYQWLHQFALPTDGNQRKRMPYMALKGDTATSAQAISVEFSDTDYASFQTARTIDMTSNEKMLTRCGSWKGGRVVRLSHTGNSEVRLQQFLARIE